VQRKFLKIGLLIILAGLVITVIPLIFLFNPDIPKQSVMFFILTLGGSLVIFVGLGFSIYDIAKSIMKRLKESHKREKANRDRQHQARQDKDGSTSQ
jgi:uncharacterized protein YacL